MISSITADGCTSKNTKHTKRTKKTKFSFVGFVFIVADALAVENEPWASTEIDRSMRYLASYVTITTSR